MTGFIDLERRFYELKKDQELDDPDNLSAWSEYAPSSAAGWPELLEHRADNPAGEALGEALGRQQDVVRHMPALPHVEVAAAVDAVRASGAWAGTKLAFEYLVLTVARSAEVRLATWDEIDLDAAVWTVLARA